MMKVTVRDDVDGLAGLKGTIVSESEDGCVHGQMFEVLFDNGDSEWLMPDDLIFA